MAENKNKNKFNALFERFVAIAESVSEENYENEDAAIEEQETAADFEATLETTESREFFDFEKAEEIPMHEPEIEPETIAAEETRKIDSEEIFQLLEINGIDTQSDEKENTMVFKTAADVVVEEDSEYVEDVDETHVFEKVVTEEPVDEEEPFEDEYEPRDFRPIRRNRHYRMGCMGGVMYFLAVVCISVILASFAWLAANDVLSLNKELVTAEITVSEDFTIEEIARQLEDKGIIEYSFLFELFSKFSTAEEKITPGTYTLSSHLDYRAIVTNLQETSGPLKTITVTIPEGRNMMETFQLLEDNGVCEVEVLMECASNYEFDYDFLNPDKLGTEKRLEGFLFPDTYEFYVDSDPEDAIEKFLDNFERRVKEHMYVKAEEMGYTFDEIMTIASMIEMEAASDSERTTIASVIYNRLNSYDFPRIQIDATVQYALGEHKESLSYDDLQVDSPYNTYLYEGLPPGPISNPGIVSIGAALNPEDTNYYYYALSTDGTHKFFTYYSSFEEFTNSSDYGG